MKMNFFKELQLFESEKIAARETQHVVDVVNTVYNEWKKTGRRKNAVDLVTSSTNKFSNIHPQFIEKVHEATRLKMATILMRCMDIQNWKPLDSKEKTYRRLFPLIKKLETYVPETGTGATLRQVIMTRLSAAVTHQSEEGNDVFVAYEPIIPNEYLRYLFGAETPKKTFRMESLSLPDDFDSLINMLKLNHDKCVKKYNSLSKT